MQKRQIYLLLFGIIIIATFLRTYHIQQYSPGLYPDEAMNGTNGLEANRTGDYKVFYPENNGREGLFINIQALTLKATGLNEPWVLRSVSTVFGTLTVLGVFFLAFELFSPPVALLSAFLTATSFWHLVFSRMGFRAITAPFWLVWGLYFLVKSLKRQREGAGRTIDSATNASSSQPSVPNHTLYAIWSMLLAGVVFGFGFHSYIAYRATPAIAGFIVLVFWYYAYRQGWQKRFFTGIASFSLGFLIAIAPLMLYFAHNPADFLGRTSQVSVFSSVHPLQDLGLNILKTVGMFFFVGDWNWRHNFAGHPELFWPVSIFFLAGLVVSALAIVRVARRRADETETRFAFGFGVCLVGLSVAALPVVISNEGIPHALRAILMIPMVMILAGAGGVALYEIAARYIPRKIVSVIAGIILVLLPIEAYRTYFVLWGPNPNTADAFAVGYVQMGDLLRTFPDSIPKYVIVRAGGVLVRGLPMPTQTVMFLTDTFGEEQQRLHNLYYVLPENENQIPPDSLVFELQ